jgi:DNA polymerase-3 subunit epsilon
VRRNIVIVFNWLKKKHPLIRENRKYFSGFDHNRSLKEYSFVVFDTELTGLDRRSGEIISFGAIRISNLQIDLGQTYYEKVRPVNIKHTQATLIHKITPEQLKDAPLLEEVVPRFIEFLGTSLIVGHCVGIDMDFLNKACRKLYGGTLANPTIDTMRLSRGYQRKLYGRYHDHGTIKGSYNLHDLSCKFQIPVFEQHDALEDAIQTAYLFLFLIKKFRSGGLETLKDLYQASKTGTWDGEV